MAQVMRRTTRQKKLFGNELSTPRASIPGSPTPELVNDSGDDGATTVYGLSPQRTPQASPTRHDRIRIAGIDDVQVADLENARMLFDDLDDDPVRSQEVSEFLDKYEDDAHESWKNSIRFPLARGITREEFEDGEDWLDLIQAHERREMGIAIEHALPAAVRSTSDRGGDFTVKQDPSSSGNGDEAAAKVKYCFCRHGFDENVGFLHLKVLLRFLLICFLRR